MYQSPCSEWWFRSWWGPQKLQFTVSPSTSPILASLSSGQWGAQVPPHVRCCFSHSEKETKVLLEPMANTLGKWKIFYNTWFLIKLRESIFLCASEKYPSLLNYDCIKIIPLKILMQNKPCPLSLDVFPNPWFSNGDQNMSFFLPLLQNDFMK